MLSWRFELLGGVRVSSGSLQLEDLVGKKTGALLALLALTPGRTRPREEVIDLLWPEVEFDEARNRFRQLLARLRKQLEPPGVEPGSVLIADRTQVGIATGHQSDVAELQQHLRLAAAATELSVRAQHLRSALALYAGDFAPGFYLDVLLTERERLAELVRSARERLAALEPTPAGYPVQVATREERGGWVRTENRFFGRVNERIQLQALLQENRLVTLLGPGGTGKTRLAQELKVPFVPLGALTQGAHIPDAIVAALDLPDSNKPALLRLQAAFADKATTLVLDNIEPLLATGGAAVVSELLQALPSLRLLTTSRLKLDLPQECVFALAPLPPDDAVALFLDRARLAKANFETSPAVDELCQRLDGLPLAIELAAARAAVLTPEQMLERLARRFDLLTDKRRDREERHRSLRATLDWGWSLLAPDVQRFFSQLCVFRGSFTLEAAEAVTQEWLAIDYLQSLADASFVVLENECFRLLETLREYGGENLDPEMRKPLEERHYDFFLARASEYQPLLNGSEFLVGMQRYKRDQDNFVIALERCLDSEPTKAVELCLKLTLFWQCAYWYRPALAYLHRILAAAERGGVAEELLSRLHQALGICYKGVVDYGKARLYQEKAFAYTRAQLAARIAAGEEEATLLPLRKSIAGTLHNIATLLYYDRACGEALRYYQEAAAINRAIGNDAWRARNLSGLFSVCMQNGFDAVDVDERQSHFVLALAYAQEGTELCRAVQQDFILCYLLHAQAFVLPLLGQAEQALGFLEEGLSLSCSLEHWALIIDFLVVYYHHAVSEQRWEVAAQLLGAAQGLREKWGPGSTVNDAHLRPQINLIELLGQERYALLYDLGFHASLDSLKQLVMPLHKQSQSLVYAK